MSTLVRLRAQAISHSLFRPTTLKGAIERLGFVQADPIRSPATAQDLVLRHRVKNYRAGDLERRYHSLGIEEDFLYAYGFLPRHVRELLHPRVAHDLTPLDSEVLAAVRAGGGPVHPRKLDALFGRERAVNGWGGFSQSTKIALERLHHRGLLRIARRDNGVRVYEAAATPSADPPPPDERLRKLVTVIANVLAPVPEQTLRALTARLRRSIPRAADHRTTIRGLLASGELDRCSADGITYVWPAANKIGGREVPRRVRLLAPFDPVVWDRRRFEHLWGWAYRFEAYTPASKRVRGYYAMPLLWGEQVIGWANVGVGAGRKLTVEFGFAEKSPRDREFRLEAEAEIARLEEFIGPRIKGIA